MSEYIFSLAAMGYAQAGNRVSKLSIELNNLLKRHGFIEPKKETKAGARRNTSELCFHSLRATVVIGLRLAGVPADNCGA
ncbi:hypothetical protein [Akkermansia massiliensis]